MKKRLKTIVAAGISVIVLIAMLVILVNLPHKVDPDQTPSATELTINDAASTDISSIYIKNSRDSYTVNVLDGVCSISGLENLPTSDEKFAALTADCSGIAAVQIVDPDSDDISVFGLNNPRATATIFYNDDSSLKLNVGAEAPLSAGVYVNVNDESTVYLFSSAKVDTFLFAKTDFIDKNITPTSSNQSLPILQKATLEGSSRPQPITFELESADPSHNIYKITSPALKSTDANQISSIADQLQSLQADEVVAVNPSSDLLSSFGLSTPFSKITADYNSYSITLITNQPSDDKVYIMNPSIPIVYKMSSKDKSFITAQFYDLASKTIISPSLSSIRKLIVSAPGIYYSFDISFSDAQSLQVICNGFPIDPENFKTYYQNVIGMKNQGFTSDPIPESSALLTFSFFYSESSKSSDSVSFFPSDDPDKVLISLNGICDSFEFASYVDKLIADSIKVAASDKVLSLN